MSSFSYTDEATQTRVVSNAGEYLVTSETLELTTEPALEVAEQVPGIMRVYTASHHVDDRRVSVLVVVLVHGRTSGQAEDIFAKLIVALADVVRGAGEGR